MARTPKRYIQKDEIRERAVYRAGIYVRLSNERSESWREKSSSPQTQVAVCKDYAKDENIEVIEVYEDYEYSGTNFERPAYIRMMEDVRNRKINCIIIRDLSRLGREHIEMGRLIDKVFPFLGVRFISVSDKLDTSKGVNSNKSFEVMLKNIINDLYAKDISTKIISAKHQRARNGYFIGSVPPYGYKIDKTPQGQRLIVDEKAAPIVKMIFELTLQGKSQYEVALELNRQKIATTMHYYKTGELYRTDENNQWHKGTVSKLLTNRTYTGTLTQGKKRQNLAKGEKQRTTSEDEWIVVENAHEAIISTEDFERVLIERKERKKQHPFASTPHNFKRDRVNRYQGKVFALDSGEPMFRRTRIYGKNKDKFLYIHQTENCSGKITDNVKVSIREKDLDEIVRNLILEIASKMIDENSFIENMALNFQKRREFLKDKKRACGKSVEQLEIFSSKLYERYALGETDKESYLSTKDSYSLQIKGYQEEFSKLDAEIGSLKLNEKRAKRWIKNIFRAKDKVKIDKELVDALIDRIDVTTDRKLQIKLSFNLESLEGLYE